MDILGFFLGAKFVLDKRNSCPGDEKGFPVCVVAAQVFEPSTTTLLDVIAEAESELKQLKLKLAFCYGLSVLQVAV